VRALWGVNGRFMRFDDRGVREVMVRDVRGVRVRGVTGKG
jgi:hypothetical protein